jgi:hypothetical protein
MKVEKLIILLLLVIFLIWQCFTAYIVYGMSENLEELNSPGDLSGFIIYIQPIIWLFIVVTIGLIIDVAKRNKFLIVNSILMVAVVFIGLTFLTIAAVVSGYAPIYELGN